MTLIRLTPILLVGVFLLVGCGRAPQGSTDFPDYPSPAQDPATAAVAAGPTIPPTYATQSYSGIGTTDVSN